MQIYDWWNSHIHETILLTGPEVEDDECVCVCVQRERGGSHCYFTKDHWYARSCHYQVTLHCNSCRDGTAWINSSLIRCDFACFHMQYNKSYKSLAIPHHRLQYMHQHTITNNYLCQGCFFQCSSSGPLPVCIKDYAKKKKKKCPAGFWRNLMVRRSMGRSWTHSVLEQSWITWQIH